MKAMVICIGEGRAPLQIAMVIKNRQFVTGRGSVWLERLLWEQEVTGSSPVAPTITLEGDKMYWKRILLLPVFLLMCGKISFAGDLIAKEAGTYYNEGVKAQKAGNFDAAETAYQKTLILAPNDLDWIKFITNNRGVILAKGGDLPRAEMAFKAALEIDPNYKSACMNLGLVYEKLKNRLESLEYWAKAFEFEKLKPKDFVLQEDEK